MIGPSENHFFLGYMQYQQSNSGKDDDAAAQLGMTQQLLMDRVVFSMERDMVKKGIHLIVTAIASMCFPLVVFVYSYYFMEQPKRSSRTMRRNERIKRALEKCRKPWNNNSEQHKTVRSPIGPFRFGRKWRQHSPNLAFNIEPNRSKNRSFF